MNAITPAKRDAARPQHGGQRDVADRADEAQHGDDRADERAPDVCTAAGASVEEQPVEEVVAEQRDEAGEQEARCRSPSTASASRRGSCARRPTTPARRSARSRQLALAPDRVVLVAGLGRRGRARARLPRRAARRTAAAAAHIRTIITSPPRYSASVNCQPIRTHSTRPSSQTRFVEANWKASARRGRGALLEQALGDRDRRVGARRGRRAERRSPAPPGRGRRRPARLDALARHPGLDDRGDREAQHERPPDLPGHQHGVPEAVADLGDDVGHQSLSPGA